MALRDGNEESGEVGRIFAWTHAPNEWMNKWNKWHHLAIIDLIWASAWARFGVCRQQQHQQLPSISKFPLWTTASWIRPPTSRPSMLLIVSNRRSSVCCLLIIAETRRSSMKTFLSDIDVFKCWELSFLYTRKYDIIFLVCARIPAFWAFANRRCQTKGRRQYNCPLCQIKYYGCRWLSSLNSHPRNCSVHNWRPFWSIDSGTTILLMWEQLSNGTRWDRLQWERQRERWSVLIAERIPPPLEQHWAIITSNRIRDGLSLTKRTNIHWMCMHCASGARRKPRI